MTRCHGIGWIFGVSILNYGGPFFFNWCDVFPSVSADSGSATSGAVLQERDGQYGSYDSRDKSKGSFREELMWSKRKNLSSSVLEP